MCIITNVEYKEIRIYRDVIKRVVDIVVSFLMILVFLPLILIAFILVFSENGWPVIFKQKRVTKKGRVFNLLKIRSMVKDAEQKLKSNKKLYKKYVENRFKLKIREDPRILKIGYSLRKYSIDELMQIFNVLKGDMSIVGPRAMLVNEIEHYKRMYPELSGEMEKLFSVKAGITGLAQVSQWQTLDIPQRIKLGAYYAENINIFLDIKILLKTILVVLKGIDIP